MTPHFFETSDEFRAWLAANHERESEIWVGYFKKATGRASLTWPESVDQALCFGWIDSVRRSLGDSSFANRFTPRRRGSNWSAVNVRRVEELTALGLMEPAGLRAFEERDERRTELYSYEQGLAGLSAAEQAAFEADLAAWRYFSARPPSYRKAATWWVVSAKRADTRQRRLETLIADSGRGEPIALLRRTVARPPSDDPS
ncbi:MAG: YdeI/OmpD-associated family protein [Dehalococcoidia bacterium]